MRLDSVTLRLLRVVVRFMSSGTPSPSSRFKPTLGLVLLLLSVGVAVRCTSLTPTKQVGESCRDTGECIESGCFFGTCRVPCDEHDECDTKACLRLRIERWSGYEYAGGCQLPSEKLCGEPRDLENGLVCNRDVYVNCETQGCPLPDWCVDYSCLPPNVRNEIYGPPSGCEAWR